MKKDTDGVNYLENSIAKKKKSQKKKKKNQLSYEFKKW